MAEPIRAEGSKCLIKGCPNPARFRGLCGRCHQAARRAIRDGKTTETELLARKMLLPSVRGRQRSKSPWDVHFERSLREPKVRIGEQDA